MVRIWEAGVIMVVGTRFQQVATAHYQHMHLIITVYHLLTYASHVERPRPKIVTPKEHLVEKDDSWPRCFCVIMSLLSTSTVTSAVVDLLLIWTVYLCVRVVVPFAGSLLCTVLGGGKQGDNDLDTLLLFLSWYRPWWFFVIVCRTYYNNNNVCNDSDVWLLIV